MTSGLRDWIGCKMLRLEKDFTSGGICADDAFYQRL